MSEGPEPPNEDFYDRVRRLEREERPQKHKVLLVGWILLFIVGGLAALIQYHWLVSPRRGGLLPIALAPVVAALVALHHAVNCKRKAQPPRPTKGAQTDA